MLLRAGRLLSRVVLTGLTGAYTGPIDTPEEARTMQYFTIGLLGQI